MVDIDVDHWRNLQSLLVQSAKRQRRIVVIHERGEILKFVHSGREAIVRDIDRIVDPYEAAEQIYRANADKVDFVAVYERGAFDRYFALIQESWQYGEDLDSYVHRTYEMLDEFSEGMVTYPGPARYRLGLQWRVGATYEDIQAAVARFITPDSTVVAGVFDGDVLWTTLVLHFDADRKADVVTTVDPSQIGGVGREALVEGVIGWAEGRYGRCELAVFTDVASAREMLEATDKVTAAREAHARGALILGRFPAELVGLLAA
jgi:hypothetical protein